MSGWALACVLVGEQASRTRAPTAWQISSMALAMSTL
jgi:hypothetical protein